MAQPVFQPWKRQLLFCYVCFIGLIWAGISRADASRPQQLTWGADANSGAPYVFADPSNLSRRIGFEVEIIDAIAQDMHRQPVFVQNNWNNLIPGLQRGLYIVVINGLEITPEHETVVDFSIPYYTTYEQLVVQDKTFRLTSLKDMKGMRVGTLTASQAQRILDKMGSAEVKTYDQAINAYSDLEDGRLDAVLMDAPIALYYASHNGDLKFVGSPIGEITYGIAVRKGDAPLISELNSAIADITKSGQLRAILDRWNLWNPMTAQQTGDESTASLPPTSYNAFMAATGTVAVSRSSFAHYLSFLPLIGRGAVMTLEISILAMSIATLLGLILALSRSYAPQPLRFFAACYIECVRGTPLLVQILFIFYALPGLGVRLDPFLAGVVALGLNYSAYEAENYRSGLQAVPKGQMEVAIALNLSRTQALRYVIVPQAIRIVLPTVTNDFISLLKDSSLVSVITLVELTQVYMQLSTTYYDYLVPGMLVAAAYLLMGFPFILFAHWAERHLAVETNRHTKNGIKAIPRK